MTGVRRLIEIARRRPRYWQGAESHSVDGVRRTVLGVPLEATPLSGAVFPAHPLAAPDRHAPSKPEPAPVAERR